MSGILHLLLASGTSPFSASMTAGSDIVSGNGLIGYAQGLLGTCSPTSIPGGLTLYTIADGYTAGVAKGGVVISGFSSSPGATWLTKVTANGVSWSGSSATYSYSSGEATWESSSKFGFNPTTEYPVTLVIA